MEPDDDSNPTLPLDEAALARLRAVGDDLLAEVADCYCSAAPEQLETMMDAVQRGDIERVHLTAHNAKSNSATVGATRLAQTFEEIERRAGAGSLEGVPALLEEAKAALPAVCAALARHASRPSSGGD